MRATAEISLYPLNENYIPPIEDFIRRLNLYPELTVLTNATSTQVSGPYDLLMDVLSTEIGNTFSSKEKYVVAMKLINTDLL